LAANAISAASYEDAPLIQNWEFDLGGPLFDGGPISCVDARAIPTTMHDNISNKAAIEAKKREIPALQAVPILLGGYCPVALPFLAAFADDEPIWVLQIDAHIDWRDEVNGECYVYSSPMRRASEMPHVADTVQVGLRNVGNMRITDIKAARLYGSRSVTAREVHNQGVEAAATNSGGCTCRHHPRL
jgi:agmatinase